MKPKKKGETWLGSPGKERVVVMKKPTWSKCAIKNREGQDLSAILCRGSEAGSHCLENEGNPVIIGCHGFTGSKEGSGRAVAMAEKLALSGFRTLLFDFAGCGESEGRWENISLSGQIADLGAVVSWCRRKGFDKIILNGRSFGGTTVLCYAASDKEVDAVCTWAAVARLHNLFNRRAAANEALEGSPEELLTLEGEEGTVTLKRNFFYDLNKHDPAEAAAELAPRNLLLIHGSNDQSVPVEDAELLYKRAGEPKKLVIIDGADHRFSEHLEEVWETCFDWLRSL